MCAAGPIARKIKGMLDKGSASPGMFREAQRRVFHDMVRGTFFRFLKCCSHSDLTKLENLCMRNAAASPFPLTLTENGRRSTEN